MVVVQCEKSATAEDAMYKSNNKYPLETRIGKGV